MKNTHTKSTLRSKIVYKKDIAISFSKMAYYEVLGEDIRKLPGRDKEKLKFSTPRQERVTKLLANYKKRLMKKANGYFHILKGIYNENCLAIRNSLPPQNIPISYHWSLVSQTLLFLIKKLDQIKELQLWGLCFHTTIING